MIERSIDVIVMLGNTLRIIGFAIVGALAASFIWLFISKGYFQPWEKLPHLNVNALEIIAITHDNIYIKASDNLTYRCSRIANECWVHESVPTQTNALTPITEPCDYSSPEFFFLAGPPLHITNCVQYIILAEEGVRGDYLIDTEGNIWAWKYGTWGLFNTVMAFIVCPIVGAVLVSISLDVWLRRKNQKANSTSNTFLL